MVILCLGQYSSIQQAWKHLRSGLLSCWKLDHSAHSLAWNEEEARGYLLPLVGRHSSSDMTLGTYGSLESTWPFPCVLCWMCGVLALAVFSGPDILKTVKKTEGWPLHFSLSSVVSGSTVDTTPWLWLSLLSHLKWILYPPDWFQNMCGCCLNIGIVEQD